MNWMRLLGRRLWLTGLLDHFLNFEIIEYFIDVFEILGNLFCK